MTVAPPARGYRTFGASVTNRADPAQNQDAYAALTAERDGIDAVIVCDGLGSLGRSGEAARLAVSVAADSLRRSGSGGIPLAFEAADREIRDRFRGQAGTTMIILCQDEGGVWAAYAGNGAILQLVEVQEVGEAGPAPVSLCWTNHLLPHTAYQDGREVISAVLGLGPSRPPDYALVYVSARPTPQLLIAASDGILSREQVHVGTTSDGERWERLNPALLEVLGFARVMFDSLRGGAIEPAQFHELLEQRLIDLATAGVIDDDATVGAFLCQAATVEAASERADQA